MKDKRNKTSKLNITRRSALVGMAGAAGTIIARTASGQEIQTSTNRPFAPEDPSKVTAKQWATKIGKRSVFETY